MPARLAAKLDPCPVAGLTYLVAGPDRAMAEVLVTGPGRAPH